MISGFHAFPVKEGHYKMSGGVRLSVRLFAACLDLTRERKGLGLLKSDC